MDKVKNIKLVHPALLLAFSLLCRSEKMGAIGIRLQFVEWK